VAQAGKCKQIKTEAGEAATAAVVLAAAVVVVVVVVAAGANAFEYIGGTGFGRSFP